MKIYTISMAASVHRKEYHKWQADELGMDVNYYDAIDGSVLSDEVFESLRYTYLRPLSRGEVGCFLSHKALWEKCASINEPIIILEDDIVISADFAAATSQLLNLQDVDRINLEGYFPQRKTFGKNVLQLRGFSLTELYQERAGAAAYILWPSGALKLLNHYKNKACLADVALKKRCLATYQLEPVVAMQALVCDRYKIAHLLPTNQTTLDRTGKHDTDCFYRGVFLKLKRIADEISKGFIGLQYLFSTKRVVFVDSNKFNTKNTSSTSY